MADVIISDLNSGTVTSTTMIPASLTTVASTSATVFIQPKDFAQVLSLSSVVAGTVTSTTLLFGTVTTSAPVVVQAGSLAQSQSLSTVTAGTPASTSLLFGTITSSAPVVFQANAVINTANMFGLGVGVVTSSSLIPGGNTSSQALSFAAGSIGQVTNIAGLSTGSVNVSSSTLILGTPTSSGNVSIPLGALNTLFSTGSGTLSVGSYRVVGLLGVYSTSTPNTQFQLSADVVEIWKPSDQSKRYVVATSIIVNDITTTAANGRDQAGAFTASNWIHFYFVGPDTVTSSTLQTRASLTAPPTGPTLQTSETRWAYAGAVRLGASTTLIPTLFRGAWGLIDIADGGVSRVLSNGLSTVFASVDCSAFMPPNSRLGKFNVTVLGSLTAPGNFSAIELRPFGSTHSGQSPASILQQVAGVSNQSISNFIFPVSSSQALQYLANTNSAGGPAGNYLDLQGYLMPNGGE